MGNRAYKLSELADMVGGALSGDGETSITGVAGVKEAEKGEITFVVNSKYESFLKTTKASAVIGPREIQCPLPSIHLEDPYLAFLKVVTIFAENPLQRYPRIVHETAIIAPTAKLGRDLAVGPYTLIEAGSRIGNRSTILFGCYIGQDVKIGKQCVIYPNVTIREGVEIGDRVILHPGAVIGSDGFGFVKEGEKHRKIPHIGGVVLEDDVEIGSNTTIDRATTGVTRVCRGTKVDNLVQIAHNVFVGKNCVLAGQSGISGSTEIGDNVVIAGQAGLVGHITVGDNVIIGAQAGVTKSMPPDVTVSGYPAREHSQAKKVYGFTARLPDLYKKVQELEKKVRQLEAEKVDDQTTENDR